MDANTGDLYKVDIESTMPMEDIFPHYQDMQKEPAQIVLPNFLYNFYYLYQLEFLNSNNEMPSEPYNTAPNLPYMDESGFYYYYRNSPHPYKVVFEQSSTRFYMELFSSAD